MGGARILLGDPYIYQPGWGGHRASSSMRVGSFRLLGSRAAASPARCGWAFGEWRRYEFRAVRLHLSDARRGGDGATVDAFRATVRALKREGVIS